MHEGVLSTELNRAPAETSPPLPQLWLEALLLLAICAIGLAVRIYGLRAIPPGLYNDEAAYAIDARAVVNGARVIFFEGNSGREPLFIYLLAAAFALVGDNSYSVRLTAALVGALTVPATYFMVRAAAQFAMTNTFGRQSPGLKRLAPWLAPWVALLLALSYWHLSMSRLGFRATTLSLILAIATTFLFRTLRRLESNGPLPWSDILLTGFFAGLSLYTYMAARIVPVFVIVAIAFSLITAPRLGLHRRTLASAAAMIVAIMAVTMLPLLAYFVRHPYFFAGHALDISVLNSQIAGDGPGTTLLKNTGKFILMFFTLPDPELRQNPAARPVFDVVLGVWTVVGLVLGLVNWRRFTLFYFALWTVMLAVPSMLSASNVPSSLRAIGMMPGIFVLPIAAMLWTGMQLLPGHLSLALLVPLPFVLMTGVVGVHDYFGAFSNANRFQIPFLVAYVNLGEAIRDNADDAQWVIPLSKSGQKMENRLETVNYVVNDPTRFRSILTDAGEASAQLRDFVDGARKVNIINAYGMAEFGANAAFFDSKQILDFLLARAATMPTDGRSAPGSLPYAEGLLDGSIPYRSYSLQHAPDFTLPTTLRPTDVLFGERVRLQGLAAGSKSGEGSATVTLRSDERLWAVLEWSAIEATALDLKTNLVLLDAENHVMAHVDGMLNGDNYPTRPTWKAGETTRTYHLLQPLPGTPPGAYTLAISVYEDQSGRVYPASATGGATAQRAWLGEITLLPPLAAPQIAPQQPLTSALLGSEMELVGYDLPRTALAPGEMLGLTLYWQALSSPTRDFTAVVEIVDDGGAVAASSAREPGGIALPTSAWTPGFAVRDARTLLIAPETLGGTFTLRVRLLDGPTQVGSVLLSDVTIEGRSRLMTPPQVELPITAAFGDSVRLVGVNDLAATPLIAGAPLQLTIVWQPLATATAPLVRSVQLLDAAGVLVAQQDTIPCGGECPSTSWLPGEYLIDAVDLEIPAAVPPGRYQIITGWYDANSLQRLPAVDANGTPLAENMARLPSVVIGE